jgi:hypothetical protein
MDLAGPADLAGPGGRGVLGDRAGLVGLEGRVGTRRLATWPEAEVLATPRDPAVVKLAKYRLGPTGGE